MHINLYIYLLWKYMVCVMMKKRFWRVKKFFRIFYLFCSIRCKHCCLFSIRFRNQISFQETFYNFLRITIWFYDPEPSCQRIGKLCYSGKYRKPYRTFSPYCAKKRKSKHNCHHSQNEQSQTPDALRYIKNVFLFLHIISFPITS